MSTAPSDDWLARTRENLQGLVNLHAADEEAVPGQNAVQGAMQSLLNQDLPGAVAALKPLAESGNTPPPTGSPARNSASTPVAAIKTLRERVKTMLVQQG